MLWETDTIILPYAAKTLAGYTRYEEKYLTPLSSLPQTAGPFAGPWARVAQILKPRAMTTSSRVACQVQCYPKWALKTVKVAGPHFFFIRKP